MRRSAVLVALVFGGWASDGSAQTPRTLRWPWQRPELVRYNRVEGLSLGVRGQLRPLTPWGPLSLTGWGRAGTARLHPSLRLEASHETTARRFTWAAYRETAAVEGSLRPLGPVNSLTALVVGRDDGDYLLRSGTSLEWSPASGRPAIHRVQAYVERHDALPVGTSFAVLRAGDAAWGFRPNIAAGEGWDAGLAAGLSPVVGSDPTRPRAGVDLRGRLGVGTWAYRTLSATAHVAVPLGAGVSVGGEAGAGAAWGDVPRQRRYRVGGPATLRGYDPGALEGTSGAWARGELSRDVRFGRVRVFADAAWAGERGSFRAREALASVGVGAALVDGVLRADAAWGVRSPRGFRLELVLDAAR